MFLIICEPNSAPLVSFSHHDSQTNQCAANWEPTWATIGCRTEPGGFQLAGPCHSWWGCSRRWQSGGSCSTCENKADVKAGATAWGRHQGQCAGTDPSVGLQHRSGLQFGKHANEDALSPPLSTPNNSNTSNRQIRDKDQLSREKPVAWERLCEAAAYCWVRITPMCSSSVADD